MTTTLHLVGFVRRHHHPQNVGELSLEITVQGLKPTSFVKKTSTNERGFFSILLSDDWCSSAREVFDTELTLKLLDRKGDTLGTQTAQLSFKDSVIPIEVDLVDVSERKNSGSAVNMSVKNAININMQMARITENIEEQNSLVKKGFWNPRQIAQSPPEEFIAILAPDITKSRAVMLRANALVKTWLVEHDSLSNRAKLIEKPFSSNWRWQRFPETIKKTLDFLNSVNSPEEIVKRIRDDPHYGLSSPNTYGVRLSLARRMLDNRNSLPEKRFTSFEQIDSIFGVGLDTLHDILESFQFSKPKEDEVICLGISNLEPTTTNQLIVGGVVFEALPINSNNEKPFPLIVRDDLGQVEDGKRELWVGVDKYAQTTDHVAQIVFPAERFGDGPNRVIVHCATYYSGLLFTAYNDAGGYVTSARHSGTSIDVEVIKLTGSKIRKIDIQGAFVALTEICYKGSKPSQLPTIAEQAEGLIPGKPCECDPCTSALSPNAYYVDLLGFIADSFRTPVTWIEDRLRQPLASMPLGCAVAEEQHPQIEFANEVLVQFIAERQHKNWKLLSDEEVNTIYDQFLTLPTDVLELFDWIINFKGLDWQTTTHETLDAISTEFGPYLFNFELSPRAISEAFVSILRELGTDRSVIQSVLEDDLEAQHQFAESLGVTIEDLSFLSKHAEDVRYSDLARGFNLLQKARINILYQSLRANRYREKLSQKLEELSEAFESGAQDAPASLEEAQKLAEAFAEHEAQVAEIDLMKAAEVDATQQVAEIRDRINEVFLPKARSNLAFLSHNEAQRNNDKLPQITSIKGLGDYLHIDLSVGICHKMTRIAFAIEALQDLIFTFQLGLEESIPPPAEIESRRWAWMKNYGIWHAVQSIFLYPQNFVFPALREFGNTWRDAGWSQFFSKMVDFVDQQPRIDLVTVQAALDDFASRLSSISGVEISHMVESSDLLYLFCCNSSLPDTPLYYSTLDFEGRWSGWLRIDLGNQKLRKSPIDQHCIQDIVVVDGRVNIFLLVQEKGQAIWVTQDHLGKFKTPEALPTEGSVIHLRALVIRPRTNSLPGVPPAKILVFYLEDVRQDYRVIKIDETAELLDKATLQRGNIYTFLVAVTSLSELSGKLAAEVLQNIHKGWSPGVTVYSPVVIARYTTWPEKKLILTGSHHAEDFVWQSFQDGPGLHSDYLGLDSSDYLGWHSTAPQQAINARLFPRWDSNTAYSTIEDAVRFLLFDGKKTVNYFKYNFRSADIQVLDPTPTSLDDRIESVSWLNTTTYTCVAGVLYRCPQNGVQEVVGHLNLAPPTWTFPVEINVHERSDLSPSSTGSQPITTRNGRQYFKTVQTLQFAHFQHPGYARLYLEEFFLHAPIYLAAKLNEEERYKEANDVLSVVFQPFITLREDAEDRKIVANNLISILPNYQIPLGHLMVSHRLLYLGFHSEDINSGPHLDYRGNENFLDSPLSPHELTQYRPLTYARHVVQAYLDNLLDWADVEFSRDTPESVPRARELYEATEQILSLPDLPKDLCYEDYSNLTLPAAALGDRPTNVASITRGFCIPCNPFWDVIRFRVDSNLEKLRTCRNIAGVKRDLQAYAAPVDAVALVEAVASGAELDDFIPDKPPPLYRYSFLLEHARHLVQVATHFESYLLSVFEKLDQEAYSLLQARNDLRLSNESISLQSLQVRLANQSTRLANLQVERVKISYEYFDQLINKGHSDLEIAAIAVMISTATGQAIAAGVSAYYGQYQQAAQWGAAALQTTSSVLQTYAAFERREQEWKFQRDLSSKDIDIAEQGIFIAGTEVDIAEKERHIAVLSSELTADTIDFLGNRQFTNLELYRWMSKELRKLYRKQLNMAQTTALAAQQALAFELQQSLNFISFQYGDTEHEGLLGAEKLTLDIEKLEQYRISQAERRREITERFSLAAMMPGEFQRLKKTGVLEFGTPAYIFDQRAPGEYQRLIKSIELTVVALIPPTRGIRATLTNYGISRVMTGPPFAEATVIQRQPETISLSSAVNASGLFELRLDDPMLLPFEGSGVDTMWTLEMLPGANAFNFDTIFDIIMTVRYTAREDWGYRQKVIATLQDGFSNTVAVSAKNAFPDSWYDFNNPQFGGPYGFNGAAPLPPYCIRFGLDRNLFPPNERNHRIKQVVVAAALEREMRIPISVVFQSSSGVQINADNKDIVKERVSLKTEFSGKEPYGNWFVVVNTKVDETLYPELFEGASTVNSDRKIQTDPFRDMLLIIEYSAELRF